MKRWLRTDRWSKEIAALDPKQDAQLIVGLMINHVFPLEFLVSLELAQFRTFTIPTISALLHATRQYEDDGIKRLDDTRAIMAELHANKVGGREHDEMLAHLNAIHGVYRISNDDYLYTLSTFMLDPVLFIDKHGHRKMTRKEKDAMFFFYRELGEAMKIQSLPDSLGEMLSWRRSYEARVQRYAPSNEAVARGMLAAVRALTPPALHPLLEPGTVALIGDEKVRVALGFAPASPALALTVRTTLRAQRRALRKLNLFEVNGIKDWPVFAHYPTYPNGYYRLNLGPARVLELLEKKRAKDAA